ncbi:hypothetical protein [Tenggerimyces flavus]|uniref:CdiI immunity protein domain-containing protein n=1 Tax=Tenggerimyces flavus TaxID=1708749 RepID=A0ABV7YJ48_9ACTN|nr:hypothetical protein [Tenggerimyces flavus]MBM7786789.1 hypothetical protein [Tenggerimyces flavus]
MRDPDEPRDENREEPFAILIDYAATFFHPETTPRLIDTLRAAVRKPIEEQGIDTRAFVKELRQALSGDTVGLPDEALWDAAEYSDGTDEAFLKRVWEEIFPGEALPTRQ